MKDKRAFIFYFLMTIIFLDFGEQLRKLSHIKVIKETDNFLFSITHVNNTGSAFGLFQNSHELFAIIAICVIIFILFYVIKYITFDDKLELYSLTLFSSGALGNAIERLRFGYVMDYIKLNFIDFPIFNAFDIMINISIIIYLFYIFSNIKRLKDTKK